MTPEEARAAVGRAAEHRPAGLRRCEEGQHCLISDVVGDLVWVKFAPYGGSWVPPGELRELS